MIADTVNIKSYFLEVKKQSQFLSELFDFFETRNIEFGFLGGAVRAAINGAEDLPRDFDIVFDSNDRELDDFLQRKGISFKRNSFGGRKIQADNLVFDIWALSKHHLIAEKKYTSSFKNISRTTFINYDSVFFDWTKQKLIGEYSDCLQSHLIDFVGNKKYQKLNKQSDVTICKLASLNNQGFLFSVNLDKYISNYIKSYFVEDSLFEKREFFNCFIYNYNRHCGFKLDEETKDVIYKFVLSYL